MKPMIGRSEELQAALEVLSAAADGRLKCCFIEGEPGIGKTLLTNHIVDVAQHRGFAIYESKAYESEAAHPLSVLQEAFGTREGPRWTRQRGTSELNVLGDEAFKTEMRMQEELLDLIEHAAVSDPVLLVIDDLQWADPSSVQTLATVKRRFGDLPVAVVLSLRTQPQSEGLGRLVRSWTSAGAKRVMLGPLDEESLKTLIESASGKHSSEAVLEQSVALGGNPLLALELAEAAKAQGKLATGSALGRGIPDSVRSTLLSRTNSLSVEALETLKIASTLSSTFKLTELSALTARDPAALMRSLDEAAGLGVLVMGGDQIAFRHDLLREALYSDMAPSMRRALHQKAAAGLESIGASPYLVAWHVRLGAEPGDAGAAHRLAHMGRKLIWIAPAEAVRIFDEALEIMAPTDPSRAEVLADMVLPLAWLGDVASIERAEETVSLTFSSGIGPDTASNVRKGLVEALTLVSRYDEALAVIDEQLHDEQLQDPERAEFFAAKSYILAESRRVDAAKTWSSETQELIRASGNKRAAFLAAMANAIVNYYEGRFQPALETLELTISSTRDLAVTSPLDGIRANFYICSIELQLDRFDEAQKVARRGQILCEHTGSAIWLPNFLDLRARANFFGGSWDDALAEAEAAVAMARELEWPGEWLSAPGLIATIELARGNAEAATQALTGVGAEGGSVVSRVRVLTARGEEKAALDLLDRHLVELKAGYGGVFDVRAVGMRLVETALRHDRLDLARQLTEAAEEFAQRVDVPSAKGMALFARGLTTRDSQLLIASIQALKESPRKYDLGVACEVAGQAISPIQPEVAKSFLEDALLSYEALECSADSARLRKMMRGLGIHVSSRSRIRHSKVGWDALTPTELQVAELAANRLTTPEIAERLFISKRTVQTHLSHIFGKLGISSRTELRSKRPKSVPAADG